MQLIAEELRIHFDGVRAVDGVDLALGKQEIVGLIGPNGAGKTTFVNGVSGFARLTSGRVRVGGTDVTGFPPDRLARHGLARTFQDVSSFRGLSVAENVAVGAIAVGCRRSEAVRRVEEVLELMSLGELASLPAGQISQGHERRVAVARAVAMHPDFLLLDEPAAGLNDHESAELVDAIRKIRATFGCGVLLIDHDMRLIMTVCERIHVLDAGKTLAEGPPAAIQQDKRVVAAYLGTSRN